MKKITIAIDGHSSTGKSTLAKQLAKTLNYIYIDTGAMYRAVTLFAMQQGFITSDTFDADQLVANLNHVFLSFKFNEDLGFAEIYLNDENVEDKIRSIEVSNFVSKIAEVSAIRTKLVQQQKKYGIDKGVVMDGRDIGTVVFPDAELKIFMTASAEIRAERRYLELQEKSPNITFDEVLKNVVERDKIDSTREDSPLIVAENAVMIDNSNLTKEEQFNLILDLAHKAINAV
ncbi:cytidylate kinase [Paenimyroides ummariense]|uniref:Cytidylate kinase n=1 Tax=Paenimyroides ummariense TaxID=913024 RepID=A0A1I4YQQ2_9FLAO|nr:(d)CMP kinase [Paenimyroides ummariense]SFN40297.1 cytidylate kinase [Paenimyroides ummariense]